MADDGRVTDTTPRPTGRPNARMRQTVGDMVRSLAIVLAVVGVLLLVTWRPQPDPVREVDVAPVLAVARSQAAFPVVLPVGMADYRPTSVRWEKTPASGDAPAWHVGYVTPQTQYVQVSQAAGVSEAFVAEQTGNAVIAGEVLVDGVPWQQMASDAGMSLVRVDGDVTTIVSGTVPLEELQGVVASLRAG